MLRIRLSRVGKKKQPSYRIVVADSRRPRDGAHLAIIGHYNPLTEPPSIVVKEEQAVHWLQQGAQPSETAAKLLSRVGVMERAGKQPVSYQGKPVAPKKGQSSPPAPAAAATAAPAAAAEAPAAAAAPKETPAATEAAEAEETPAATEAAEAPAEAEETTSESESQEQL